MLAMKFARRDRWLAAGTVVFLASLLLPAPAQGQQPLAAPAPSPSSSDESVRNALREAPLPAQTPASSPPVPAPAPSSVGAVAASANVGDSADDDERHVALVGDAAALRDVIMDPAAAVIEIGKKSKNGVAVREREMETEMEMMRKDFFLSLASKHPALPQNTPKTSTSTF